MSYGNYCHGNYCDVNVLVGKTLASIDGGVDSGQITFVTTDGEMYTMLHEQDCCEYVSVEDIVGDLQDLVGSEILLAEEVEGESPSDFDYSYHDSCTWTFYKFATIKGYVDIRWFGSSNGYYSEGVSFRKESPR